MTGPLEPTQLEQMHGRTLEPSIVLPSQFFARATPTPEKLLLLAVLEEAIATYQRYVIATDRRGLALFAEVEAWLASEDTAWMFSYAAICDELGVDTAYLRLGLRRWKDGHRAALETWSSPLPSPVPPSEQQAALSQRAGAGADRGDRSPCHPGKAVVVAG